MNYSACGSRFQFQSADAAGDGAALRQVVLQVACTVTGWNLRLERRDDNDQPSTSCVVLAGSAKNCQDL